MEQLPCTTVPLKFCASLSHTRPQNAAVRRIYRHKPHTLAGTLRLPLLAPLERAQQSPSRRRQRHSCGSVPALQRAFFSFAPPLELASRVREVGSSPEEAGVQPCSGVRFTTQQIRQGQRNAQDHTRAAAQAHGHMCVRSLAADQFSPQSVVARPCAPTCRPKGGRECCGAQGGVTQA